MNIDSIIFDLDGTLWDSTEGVLESWNQTMEKFSEIRKELTVEDIKGVMGLTIEDIAVKLFPDLDDRQRLNIIKQCCEDECKLLEVKGGVLFPKLEEVLKELSKKYKLFIVSNCQCGYIEAFFKAHKLEEYFVDFENPGRTGLTKGENIKLVMERNNLKSSIYVGDTAGDQKAAKVAGIPFIYARYGFGEVNEYDYIMDSFEELLEIV
ncbi:MAG: HAD family hydrolase [Clostridiales bacterium]|mgnify:CR=1 FL=1|uniref:HAD family hydrolase n=1 Tax=Clostridium sp. N3C TaxID=1776758 RepID=UPI00092DEE0F|nr:HAD family hydrolase [Clostridium sp. N3C]NLZ48582.1 HAD family hydrolase [Clostridiales bacterium]SCN24888.1 Phosphoglycolate phosphatase, chromosomal [Clostridium sp. N3C]